MPPKPGKLAVALHEIEPATFERCALIRDWLSDQGVDRVTLLVIPARDLHPLGERSPEMVQWLIERRRLGDSIAQHGFQHARLRPTSWQQRAFAPTRPARAGRTAEFVGLDERETRRAVEAGWRLLKLAGIEPDGFVAPAYAYTPALRRTLNARFRWWASVLSLHGAVKLGEPTVSASATPGETTPDRRWRHLAPTWSFGTERPLGRALSPLLIRMGTALAGQTLRLDLHPTDFDHARHTLALQWAMAHAHSRTAVTYDELAAAERSEELIPSRAATVYPNRSSVRTSQ